MRVLVLGGTVWLGHAIAAGHVAAGHDVTVVDPSPDALASLARRAAETGATAAPGATTGGGVGDGAGHRAE